MSLTTKGTVKIKYYKSFITAGYSAVKLSGKLDGLPASNQYLSPSRNSVTGRNDQVTSSSVFSAARTDTGGNQI
jgi:hypothetical protein